MRVEGSRQFRRALVSQPYSKHVQLVTKEQVYRVYVWTGDICDSAYRVSLACKIK